MAAFSDGSTFEVLPPSGESTDLQQAHLDTSHQAEGQEVKEGRAGQGGAARGSPLQVLAAVTHP